MSFPATRAALEFAGYRRQSSTFCMGCNQAMEFWTTPQGKSIPMDVMTEAESPAISHFATCPLAQQFRRRKQGKEKHER